MEPSPFLRCFEVRGLGVFFLKSPLGGAPSVSLRARAARGAGQSLRPAQWKVGGFVQSLDFSAVEPLVTDLQPRAEGFGRA